jgi:hypothetical protein
MSQNEAFAAAAHLHVLLRRTTGRVTDTEWMVANADYARAIVRFARDKAASESLPELLPLADRLETLVAPPVATPPRPAAKPPGSAAVTATQTAAAPDVSARYIGRLR